MIGAGFFVKFIAGKIWDLNNIISKISLLLPVVSSGIFYLVIVAGIIWSMPWLISMSRNEIKNYVLKYVLKIVG